MGWKVKICWEDTELKHPDGWIESIIHDSIVFTGDESKAFEFNNINEFGGSIHRLKTWWPKLKYITKPVLRIIK